MSTPAAALPRITEPVTLSGTHAQLVPLAVEHAAALTEAVKDGELWKLWYTAIPTPEGMVAEIERRLGLLRSAPDDGLSGS